MKIGEILHNLRLEKGWTLESVAKVMGISRQTMSRYETGVIEAIPYNTIERLAKFYDVPPAYIMGWRDRQGHLIDDTEVMIPEVATVAAGFDKLPITDFEYEKFPIPKQYTRGFRSEDLFIIKVRGDSMYPLYQDGDRILAVRSQKAEDGNVAILQYGDYATIKTIRTHPNGLELIPTNPMFKPELVTENDAVRVIGLPILLLREIMKRD